MENSQGQKNNNQEDMQNQQGSEEQRSAMPASDSNSDHQVASPSRGGTTDMGNEALRNATGVTGRGNRGSGITTKRSVTGSDYDGQVSEG